MGQEKFSVATMFCPQCGHKIIGYKSEDGTLKVTCDRCRAVIFSKPHKKKEMAIRVVAKKAIGI